MISNEKKQTVNYEDLMELGFPEHTARDTYKQRLLQYSYLKKSRESSGNVIN